MSYQETCGSGRPVREGAVSGFLHEPEKPTRKGLVLTHSAGGNCRTPLLVAAARVFCHSGYVVLRCDLAFRQRRAFGPPFPNMAEQDRAGLQEAVAWMRGFGLTQVFLSGHSYGGRQASLLCAAEPGLCEGLLLLSYPLHPPKKTAELRTAHFLQLKTPVLFVHGTKDPFGSIEEMRSALQLIPARKQLIEIQDAGHDLHRGDLDVVDIVNRFERCS